MIPSQNYPWTGICLILCLLFSSHLQAQNAKAPSLKWGDVDPSHLSLKAYDKDPDASALILLDHGKWDIRWARMSEGMGFKAIFKRHVRIKVLREEGLEWADNSLKYLSINDLEEINDFKAQTINSSEDKPVYSPLNKEHIFKTELDDYETEIKFIFPKAKVGSILEFSYELVSQNIFSLKPWFFQNRIPTLHSELHVSCPKNVDYLFVGQNPTNRKLKNYEWIFTDVQRLQEESYVTNMDHFRLGVKFELKKFKRFSSRDGMTFSLKSNLYESWEDLAKDYHYKTNSIPPYQYRTFHKMITDIIGEETDSLQMMRLIYEHVRDSIEWDGRYSYKITYKAEDLMDGKPGNGAEINAFLSDMLKLAGIDSDVLLISTRDSEPYTFDLPRLTQFNHLICIASLNNKLYIMDAIDKSRPFDLLASNDLNQHGRLISPDGSAWIEIRNTYTSHTSINTLLTLNPEGTLHAKVRETFKGYAALDMREAIQLLEKDLDSESLQTLYKQRLEDDGIEVEMDSVRVKNLEEPDAPLILNYEFNNEDLIEARGDYLYLSPFLVYGYKENPFPEETRKHPIDFNYRIKDVYACNIAIPTGYEIESIPQNIKITLPNNEASITFICLQSGPHIQLRSDFSILRPHFGPDAYPYIKEIFDNMIAKHSEQIVLKKISE